MGGGGEEEEGVRADSTRSGWRSTTAEAPHCQQIGRVTTARSDPSLRRPCDCQESSLGGDEAVITAALRGHKSNHRDNSFLFTPDHSRVSRPLRPRGVGVKLPVVDIM